MAELEWHLIDDVSYESGVDHGVINLDGTLIPWNGLISVTESEVSTSELVSSYDGNTYANLQFGGFYQGKVSAVSFPDDAFSLLGMAPAFSGFYLTHQPRASFDFSYRTMVNESDYKLHFVHDATLSPVKYAFETIGSSTKPNVYEWVVDAIPPSATGYLPTAHVVVSSVNSDPGVLSDLEDLLYGTSVTDPEFPSQDDIVALFSL